MKNQTREAGISLIEVLVVMVLLLIGIFSLVRLFPPGFLINQQMESRTLGTRLAKQEQDRFANLPFNLPDSIVAVEPIATSGFPGYAYRVATDIHPDDLTPGKPNSLGVDLYYYSDINRYRRIFGETVRIPIPSPTAAGRGSIYVLSSGPIYNVNWYGAPDSLFVRGAPLFRRVDDVSNTDISTELGPSQFAIDYDQGQVAFGRATFARKFIASYAFLDSSNRTQTIIDEEITVPADTIGWRPLVGNGGRPLVPDSETVSRGFAKLQIADPWDGSNPYQYKVFSPNDGAFANVGVLLFNPLGHDYTESSPSGSQPLTARIDYDVLDWHIIREDRPMPASAPFTVRLALKSLAYLGYKDSSYTQPYIGLFRDTTIQTDQRRDLLVYDLNNGTRIPQVDSNGNTVYTVNYREGTVTFSDVFGNGNANGNFRFFYQARGGWGLSVQKASSVYKRRMPANSGDHEANIDFAQYYVGGGGLGSSTRMYFCPMDAGKTVSLRELWYDDGSGRAVKVTNETYRINIDPARFETLTVPGVGQRVFTWLDIKDKHTDATTWDPVPAGQAVNGVQGVSFRTRVIYNNGTSVHSTANGNEDITRWNRIDLDTFLTRTP